MFNKLSMLFMALAMWAIPFSSSANNTAFPIAADAFVECTINSVMASASCDASGGTYTATITVNYTAPSGSPTIQVDLSTGQSQMATVGSGTSDQVFTFTGLTAVPADGGATVNISVTLSGGNCDGTKTNNDAFYNEPNCSGGSGCVNCIAEGGAVANTGGAGTEVCSPATTFTAESGGAFSSNGTIGSDGARTVEYIGGTITLEGGFEVFAGSTFTVTPNSSSSCTPLTGEDGEVRKFVVNNQLDTPVRISPNPINSEARVDYKLAQEGNVQVFITNLRGERVAVLTNGFKRAGEHQIRLNANDWAEGYYFLTIQTADTQITEQVVILR